MKRFQLIVLSVTCVALLLGSQDVRAQVFVLDGLSAPLHGVFPDDVLLAPGGPVLMPGAAGLPLPPPPLPPLPPVDVDALSFSHIFKGSHKVVGAEFSVAPGSVGVAGTAVAGESGGVGFLDEPADIFGSALAGGNGIVWDGDGIPSPGAGGPLGLIEPGSNTNGWDGHPPFGPPVDPGFYFSITAADAAGHPVYAPAGSTGADIFFSPPFPGYSVMPALYASSVALGLVMGDDIDGLSIFRDSSVLGLASETIYFSLTPGSPTLAGLGASPADILVTTIGGLPGLAIPAGAIGLLPGDNVDALDIFAVPEPTSVVLLMLGMVAGLATRRRGCRGL